MGRHVGGRVGKRDFDLWVLPVVGAEVGTEVGVGGRKCGGVRNREWRISYLR